MLIELSIALTICSIVFVAFATVLFTRQAFVENAALQTKALFEARARLASSTSVSYLTPCLKRVTGTSTWPSAFIKKSITFSIKLSDLEYARNIGYDCGGTNPLSHFSTTSTFTTISFPLPATTTALDILQSKAYIASTINGTSTLQLYKLNDSTSPSLLSSLEISASVVMIDAIPNTLFLAIASSSNQFHIIDTTDLTKPILKNKYSLPGVAGSFPGGLSLFYYKDKVYVGTHRTAGRELHVYDVSKNPAVWLGSLEVNHNINAIAVREPYLYLATSGNTRDMIIIDATNPAAMTIASSLDIPGTDDALTIFMKGTEAYIGRKKSNTPTSHDFTSIDLTNPLNPTISSSTKYKKDITGIRVINDKTFIDSGIDSDFEGNSFYSLTDNTLSITTLNP
jgi:hypothetical protein